MIHEFQVRQKVTVESTECEITKIDYEEKIILVTRTVGREKWNRWVKPEQCKTIES